jgi:hypothetical protein
MVELQPPRARLDAVQDVAARVAAVVGAGAGLAEHLGRDDDALARDLQVLQRLAGDGLRDAAGIDVGHVDEVDAGVDRLAHESFGVGLAQVADLAPDALAAAEGHGAQAQFGHEQAGAPRG